MTNFCDVLNHKENGNTYRTYAGISINNRLEIISGIMLSHDGTMVPTSARYRVCNYACKECKNALIGNFFTETRRDIFKLMGNHAQITLGKETRTYAKCPRTNIIPEDIKPPSIQAAAFCLAPFGPDYTHNNQTAKIFELENELKKHNLMIKPIRHNISKSTLDLKKNLVYMKCPSDSEAKIGYPKVKTNPDKKEKVFGFNVIISTAIDLFTNLEPPVSCIIIPNSEKEGNHFPNQ